MTLNNTKAKMATTSSSSAGRDVGATVNNALALLGDIGGTNVRLRLVRLDSIRAAIPVAVRTQRLRTSELQGSHDSSTAVADRFLPALREFVDSDIANLKYCLLSVCGPVVDGKVVCLAPTMGDIGWLFDEQMVSGSLFLPVSSVRLVNDFVAVGLSLPHLPSSQKKLLYSKTGTASRTASCNENIACIGPGTGLGAVQLVWNEHSQSYGGYASEAGMASFCPRSELQWQLAQWSRSRQPGDNHITAETLVSGAGIVNIFRFLHERHTTNANAVRAIHKEILDAGGAELIVANLAHDNICKEAFDLFLEILGEEAGDTAMRFRPLGGLFIAGGFLSRIIDDVMASQVVAGFLNKGKTRPCCDDVPLCLALPDGDELAMFGLWQYAHSLIPCTLLNRGCLCNVFPTAESMSARAAEIVIMSVKAKPNLVLCLASGSTPRILYKLLCDHTRVEPSLFDSVRIVQLDEWVGFTPSHPATTQCFLRKHFIDACGITPDRYLQLRTDDSVVLEEECNRVNVQLAEWGGIDLAIIGIGTNGHIGLNDPTDESIAGLHCHIATLADETRHHSMLTDCNVDCRFGMTLGLADLLNAPNVLLLVSGETKQQALKDAITQPPSSRHPAAQLLKMKTTGQVHLMCDSAAASNSLF
jgi:galactosamine-6-phosphate isomerase